MTNRNLKYFLETMEMIGDKMVMSPVFKFNSEYGVIESIACKEHVTLIVLGETPYNLRLPHYIPTDYIESMITVNRLEERLLQSDEFKKNHVDFLEYLKVNINEHFDSIPAEGIYPTYTEDRAAADEIINLFNHYYNDLAELEEENKNKYNRIKRNLMEIYRIMSNTKDLGIDKIAIYCATYSGTDIPSVVIELNEGKLMVKFKNIHDAKNEHMSFDDMSDASPIARVIMEIESESAKRLLLRDDKDFITQIRIGITELKNNENMSDDFKNKLDELLEKFKTYN